MSVNKQTSNTQPGGQHKCVIVSDFIRAFRTALAEVDWPPDDMAGDASLVKEDIQAAFGVLFLKLNQPPAPDLGGTPGTAWKIASDLVSNENPWPENQPVPEEWSSDEDDFPPYRHFEIAFIMNILTQRYVMKKPGGGGPKGSPPPPPDSD